MRNAPEKDSLVDLLLAFGSLLLVLKFDGDHVGVLVEPAAQAELHLACVLALLGSRFVLVLLLGLDHVALGRIGL